MTFAGRPFIKKIVCRIKKMQVFNHTVAIKSLGGRGSVNKFIFNAATPTASKTIKNFVLFTLDQYTL